MRKLVFLVPLSIAVACSAESSSVSDDDADPTSKLDASSARDATPSDADEAPADGSAGDAKSDASKDAAANDAGADAKPDAKAPRQGAGQCFTDANCGAGKTCVATAPGGFCSGCTGTCDVGPADQCNFGTCNASCDIDDDCAAGLRCNSTGTCVLKSCSGAGSCDPWHTCTGGFCRRVSCDLGEPCPTDTDCKTTSMGKLCVETFLSYP